MIVSLLGLSLIQHFEGIFSLPGLALGFRSPDHPITGSPDSEFPIAISCEIKYVSLAIAP